MGLVKDWILDQEELQADFRLAKRLGISYDELAMLDYDMDSEESEDGLIYNYFLTFHESSPKEILSKIEGLADDNTIRLSSWQIDDDDYFEEQYDAIISNKHYYNTFLQSIHSSTALNKIEIEDNDLLKMHKRQIYISIIAALEAFLSETFINLTEENHQYFRNFIETFPDFKETKIEISRIFAEQERIKQTGRKVMVEVMYHNLAKVSKMYASTFNIVFPNISELSKCISIRHDLVHRNGKTTKGENVEIDSDSIKNLINQVIPFVDEIAKKLKVMQ